MMIRCLVMRWRNGRLFWFADAQWERIAPLLSTDMRGKAHLDDRRVLSGIVYALRCGGRWADCAEVYGSNKARRLGRDLQRAGRRRRCAGPAVH